MKRLVTTLVSVSEANLGIQELLREDRISELKAYKSGALLGLRDYIDTIAQSVCRFRSLHVNTSSNQRLKIKPVTQSIISVNSDAFTRFLKLVKVDYNVPSFKPLEDKFWLSKDRVTFSVRGGESTFTLRSDTELADGILSFKMIYGECVLSNYIGANSDELRFYYEVPLVDGQSVSFKTAINRALDQLSGRIQREYESE